MRLSLLGTMLIGWGLFENYSNGITQEFASFDAQIAEFLLVLTGLPAVIALLCALVLIRRARGAKPRRSPLVWSLIALGLILVTGVFASVIAGQWH